MLLLNKDLEKYTPRKEQKEALDFVKKSIQEDDKKFILLDLPTGVGKSILAMLMSQWYLKEVNKDARFDIITNSKILQEQYTDDFNSISSLWGKNNYDCKNYSDCSCKEGKEFNKLKKTKCDDCPYDSARDGYIKNRINLSNFHLYTLLNVYNEEMMEQRESNVLIIDEAHSFQDVFCDFISINLSKGILKMMGFKNYNSISKSIQYINNVEDFVDFADKLNQEITNTKADLKREAFKNKGSVKVMKKYSDLESLETKLENFLADYGVREENWVLEYSFDDKKEKMISVQPIWASPYLEKYVWSKYDHIILMSGTILNKEIFSYINGIPESLSSYYSITSPFSIKNRPIYYMPISRMTYKNKKNAFEQYKPFISKIMGKYNLKKGIFHTHTYEIANWMKDNIKDDRFIFHKSSDKDKALKKHYILEDKPTVLVSPSMATGVDLEYDRARFQILMKIPYPSLGSTKNKLRQKMMPNWYTWKTISGIIQAYGRGIRSYDDQCDFIIVDACFSDIMKYSSDWLPEYFSNAINMVNMKKVKSQVVSSK